METNYNYILYCEDEKQEKNCGKCIHHISKVEEDECLPLDCSHCNLLNRPVSANEGTCSEWAVLRERPEVKAPSSFWRGHPTVWVDYGTEARWEFEDDGQPVPGYGGKARPCAKCGKTFEGSNTGDPDPCLGNLPGVDNACCGHGRPELAYIRFTNGVVVKGFTEIEIRTETERRTNVDNEEDNLAS